MMWATGPFLVVLFVCLFLTPTHIFYYLTSGWWRLNWVKMLKKNKKTTTTTNKIPNRHYLLTYRTLADGNLALCNVHIHPSGSHQLPRFPTHIYSAGSCTRGRRRMRPRPTSPDCFSIRNGGNSSVYLLFFALLGSSLLLWCNPCNFL